MAVLIDTNMLVALSFPKDVNHIKAREAMQNLKTTRILSAAILPELFYMITQRVNYTEAVKSFRLLQTSAFKIETLTPEDLSRMTEIMLEYQDVQFDFVDTSLMALSERLGITQIYTLDHRDFSVFRPRHCDYLTILP